MAFNDNIQFIQNTELVNAEVANRAVRALADNQQYLKNLIDNITSRSAIVLEDQPVDSTVQVGHPVYFNTDTETYKLALSTQETNSQGLLITAQSAYVSGVVYEKTGATTASILVYGTMTIDMTNSIGASPSLGLYYLSASTAGALTKTISPARVPVANVTELVSGATVKVQVISQFRDFLSDHQHGSYSLISVPSGDYAAGGTTITNADTAVEGWLPADDASFSGNAPTGAYFGYNIDASGLADDWPPVLNGNMQVYMQQDNILDGSRIIGGPVASELVVLDDFGIWWMSNDPDQLPWNSLWDFTAGVKDDDVSVSVSAGEIEVETDLTLWYTRTAFNTTANQVLSLAAAVGSGISIVDAVSGNPATAGNLVLDLNLGLSVTSTNDTSYFALKGVSGQAFSSGPMVSSLKVDSASLAITGGEVTNEDGSRSGNIILTSSDGVSAAELPVETVQLNGVQEVLISGIIGLQYIAGRSSSMSMRILVPKRAAALWPGSVSMKVRLLVSGSLSGDLPADVFSGTYRRIPFPSALNDPNTLPTSDTALTFTTETTGLAINDYVLIESDTFTVDNGDTVMITISRASSDSYSGDLTLIRKSGVLVI